MITLITGIIAIILLVAAFPIGYYIAYLCKDEIYHLRKWIFVLIGICVLGLISSFFLSAIDISISASLLFIIIVAAMSIWKSYDRKFIVRGL